jgi:hypothetical protein
MDGQGFFHVLPALEYDTYREDDVEEGGIKIMKMAIFFYGGGRKKGKKFKK